MNLHEHQAKELLLIWSSHQEMVVENIDQLQSISQEIKNTGSEWLIVKAQIHAGGKWGGGVKLAKNDKEL